MLKGTLFLQAPRQLKFQISSLLPSTYDHPGRVTIAVCSPESDLLAVARSVGKIRKLSERVCSVVVVASITAHPSHNDAKNKRVIAGKSHGTGNSKYVFHHVVTFGV